VGQGVLKEVKNKARGCAKVRAHRSLKKAVAPPDDERRKGKTWRRAPDNSFARGDAHRREQSQLFTVQRPARTISESRSGRAPQLFGVPNG